MAAAVRRGYFFDVPFMHGRPETVARESILMGTALSAPVIMLVVHAGATGILVRGESVMAARWIGGIGAVDVVGYLCERHVRLRLKPSGWDPVESPMIVTSILLAAALPVLARLSARSERPGRTP